MKGEGMKAKGVLQGAVMSDQESKKIEVGDQVFFVTKVQKSSDGKVVESVSVPALVTSLSENDFAHLNLTVFRENGITQEREVNHDPSSSRAGTWHRKIEPGV